jgi:hypothetical protein
MASKTVAIKSSKPEPTAWKHECANNVTAVVVGDTLTLTVDLSKPGSISASGKTFTIGSTNGFLAIGSHPGITVGLNVNRRRES